MTMQADQDLDGKPEMPEGCEGFLDLTPTLMLCREYDASVRASSEADRAMQADQDIETIDDLVVALTAIRAEHGNLPVRGTWEGVVRDIDIYVAFRGEATLLIDCDGGFYKEDFLSGSMGS